jgi:hypothetical protein
MHVDLGELGVDTCALKSKPSIFYTTCRFGELEGADIHW